eukprot:Plantae.Rhodophyta-Hildenbrandia_rubra.ctg31533.p1 GENE.Plantae.Rhodophyta-Hildenbrandia_rubra.ctg31533~~Plantae.Rhodophyta-Hildenbrandia_rubra.ctg31533.p1  ORF type:complete len:191 (-),score=14.92 Plantae.Rhodophyta-Hildenbrandia_rubra.ctg31533:19-591(-)
MRRALSGVSKGCMLKGFRFCMKLDGRHFLDRHKRCLHGSTKAEPLCRLFMRLMSNAAHATPSDERERVINGLSEACRLSEGKKSEIPEGVIQLKASRLMPFPQMLARRIQSVIDLFKGLKLSDGRAAAHRGPGRGCMEEMHALRMRHAVSGCVSDPEGASMHIITGENSSGELVYRCMRGASPLEGARSR